MAISNEVELQLDINNKMKVVIDNVAKDLVKELMNTIDKEVYQVHNPSFYIRTYQLRDSWYNTAVKSVGNYVSSIIEQDVSMVEYNGELFQHGNPQKPLRTVLVESLDEIVNDGKIGTAFNFPQLGKRPFWDKFELYVDTNMDRMIKEEMNKIGLYTIL